MPSEDDIVVIPSSQHVRRAILGRLHILLIVCLLCRLLGLHLCISSGHVALLLAGNLLESVELLSVQFVQL
jgi:hypothetical protein